MSVTRVGENLLVPVANMNGHAFRSRKRRHLNLAPHAPRLSQSIHAQLDVIEIRTEADIVPSSFASPLVLVESAEGFRLFGRKSSLLYDNDKSPLDLFVACRLCDDQDDGTLPGRNEPHLSG
jgi:hypothetical protein